MPARIHTDTTGTGDKGKAAVSTAVVADGLFDKVVRLDAPFVVAEVAGRFSLGSERNVLVALDHAKGQMGHLDVCGSVRVAAAGVAVLYHPRVDQTVESNVIEAMCLDAGLGDASLIKLRGSGQADPHDGRLRVDNARFALVLGLFHFVLAEQ
jgi:hypothetical protein